MRISLFTFLLSHQLCVAQGWQQLGPELPDWQATYNLTGRWLSVSTFDLAAVTDQGIAVYSSSGSWDYPLHNIEGTKFQLGRTYRVLEFSPWEPDSCFVGYYIHYTEADLHLTKSSFPPDLVGSGTGGICWLGPLSAIIPPGSDSMVFAGVCGVQKSTDRGNTWEQLVLEEPWGLSRLVSADLSNPEVVYRATEDWPDRTLYRSMDGGLTWEGLYSPLPPTGYTTHHTTLIAHGDTVLLGLWSFPADTSDTGAILRTSDGGTTWSTSYDQGRTIGLTRSASGVYAAVTDGVIRSVDWGLTWVPFNNGLPTTDLSGIVADPHNDTVYVSTTSHGVLKVWSFLTDVDNDQPLRPDNVILHQNYPNPFNPNTTISFSIPRPGDVSLRIFNLLGEEVATLVSGHRDAGPNNIQWDASGQPTGVYFYRLQAGGFVETRKLVLVR